MAGADYLAFFGTLDPARATFGATTRHWILDPNGKTYGKPAQLTWYSLGLRCAMRGGVSNTQGASGDGYG
jgi:hypothetical protein